MELNLTGKKAIVTGGSSGIGKAITKELLAEGVQVLITGRNEERLKDCMKSLNSHDVRYLVWDVADISTYKDNLQKTLQIIGKVDILVNNAGVLTKNEGSNDFFNITEEEYDLTQSINMKGVFFMCQLIADYMIKNEMNGSIINIASEMGVRPVVNTYGMSKWGVVGLTKGIGPMLAPKGINVNAVAPGPTTTKMMGWSEGDKNIHPNIPIGRWACPEEIASLVCYLASEKGKNFVGEIIVCDGGDCLRKIK